MAAAFLLLVGCSPCTCPNHKAEPEITTPSVNDAPVEDAVAPEDIVAVTEILESALTEVSTPPSIESIRVNGKVTFADDGSPVPTGTICFETDKFLARATIKTDGTYAVVSSGNEDGLPLGIYRVYITGAEKTTGQNADGEPIVEPLIDPKFASSTTSGIAIDIQGRTTVDITVDRFSSKNVAVSDDNKTAPVSEAAEEQQWTPLFDGESIVGWSIPVYGGDGTVDVQEGNIVIGRGASITGIRYEKEFPKINYEIQYDAQRTEGYDFFAACTFPVGDRFCTFVNGGWGGGLIGLSSINGFDASENETGDQYDFKEHTWYRFRISVKKDQVQVWINAQDKEKNWEEEKRVVAVEVGEDTDFSTRMEMGPYKPLGFCTYSTEGQLRNIKYRSH